MDIRFSDSPDEPESKRRKVRKGTRSCWECRRRKEKCTFQSSTDAICIRCQRRGVKCVGQEFPEVEPLVEQTWKRRANDLDPLGPVIPDREESENVPGLLTPTSTSLEPSRILSTSSPSAGKETIGFGILRSGSHSINDPSFNSGRFEKLSQALYHLLPSPDDTARILQICGNMSTSFFRMLTVPYDGLSRGKPMSTRLFFHRPGLTTHPVLIARYMLYVATFLQHIPGSPHQGIPELSEPPHEIMDRLADSAIALVISNDDLVACIEGLECMMIQSWYQVNGGNLRKALIAVRRAMTVAQLMGLHRAESHIQCKLLDPHTEAHPQFLWFRCLSLERHLCLMLGLPHGTLGDSMASEAALKTETPMGYLERIHCVISFRILERNHSALIPHDYSLTREIDGDLQKAATELPCKWWLTADLVSVKDQPEAMFWEMRRLFHQLYHYNLLIQIHLPYMICSPTGQNYDYSRITCVNAAREILSRFLAFRNFNIFAFSCRTFDFFCLMGAMTLLLAHIDGHRRVIATSTDPPGQHMTTSESLLAHQRPGDRALVEQIQESFEYASRTETDKLSTDIADLLRQLMNIEAEAAAKSLALPAKTYPHISSGIDENKGHAVHLQIPYLGTIQITHNGSISKLPNSQTSIGNPNQSRVQAALGSTSDVAREQGSKFNDSHRTSHGKNASGDTGDTFHVGPSVGSAANVNRHVAAPAVSQCSSAMDEPLLGGYEDPLFAVGTDDWAFQGVDMAFFDNLMRWSGDDSNE